MCDKVFKTQEYLHKHKTTVPIGQDISCNHCDQKFTKTSNLNHHKRSVHGSQKDYCCKICGQEGALRKGMLLEINKRESPTVL